MNCIHFYKPFTVLLFSALIVSGCGSSFQSRVNEYSSILSEESRCETSTIYASGVSLVGTASFEKRSIEVVTENVPVAGTPPTNLVKLKNMALSDPLPAALPIKFAEVIVYNSDNKRVQCGITNNAGQFTSTDLVSPLRIPNIKGNYKLRVISRSYIIHNGDPTDFTYVSVKQDKYRNELHALTADFNLNGATSIAVDLLARARQTDSANVEGGAFNILNSIQTAFDYVKTNTGTVNTKCLASKVNVFWKAGFNPFQYESPEADPQTLGAGSYYLPSTKELYISGGQLGDMSLSNTDHFDDFAIVHELGHFVEDHCGQYVSQGGNHTLISRIDPRLAWSEGWSNYFSAHVIKAKINDLDPTLLNKFSVLSENAITNSGWTYFFTSYGFSDSVQNIGNGDGLLIDFKKSGTDPGSYLSAPYTGQEFDKVSPTNYPGEGHTREGAISRGLFKVSNTCGTYCATTPVSFENIWKSFDRETGIAVVYNPFSGSDKILEKLKSTVEAASPGSWTTGTLTNNSVIESEALHLVSNGTFGLSPLVWPGYGTHLVSGSACTLRIQPRSDGTLNGNASDQRYSNHFYTLDMNTMPGLSYVTATFTKVTGTNTDHDLILFDSDYYFNDDYTCGIFTNGVCSSFSPNRNSTNEDVFVMNRNPAATLGTSYAKSIFLPGINTTKKYLLDVRAWTAGNTIGGTTEYEYTLNSNLGILCPQ